MTTKNVNKTKKKGGKNAQETLTPRGQLHNETIYGSRMVYLTKEVKVNASLDREQILQVGKKKHRLALLNRLDAFENEPKKAFAGKNSIDKNPIYIDEAQSVLLPEKVKLVYHEKQ